MIRPAIRDIDTVILAGGFGTRVRSVLGDVPKALAPIGGIPFVDLLLRWLGAQGLRRVVLCLGYQSENIERYLSATDFGVMTVETVVEPTPLGTGGALRNAAPMLASDPVLVMNGDTLLDFNLGLLVDAHFASGAGVSILCIRSEDCSRYGTVVIDAQGRIRDFLEKGARRTGPGLVSAGLYLFSSGALRLLEERAARSLEIDFLQSAEELELQGVLDPTASFYDIGTPESLAGISAALPPSWCAILSELQP